MVGAFPFSIFILRYLLLENLFLLYKYYVWYIVRSRFSTTTYEKKLRFLCVLFADKGNRKLDE